MSSLTYNPIPFDHTYILYDPSDPVSIACSFLSLLPIIILIFYFSWFLTTREIEPVIVAGGQVVNDVVNNVVKHVIKQERPHPGVMGITSRVADTPSHFSSTLGRGLEYGMPSAHAQFMGFFMVYFALRTVYQSQTRRKSLSVLAYAAACFGVAFSRVYLLYHTVEQVAVGVLVGISAGAVYFCIISVARDIGFIGWIVNWRIVRWFWIKDSLYECPMTFEEEYHSWLQRKRQLHDKRKAVKVA